MPCYSIQRHESVDKIDWRLVPAAPIAHYRWLDNGFCPPSFAQLAWTPDALAVRLRSQEPNPRRTFTEPQSMVCLDSCLEFFVNFTPLDTPLFFNFETNPNGAMLSAYGPPRYDRTFVDLPRWLPQMDVRAEIDASGWGLSYQIPWALVREFQPGFTPEPGRIAVGNFYKCGDSTPLPHYGMWNCVGVAQPDFHRPEFFAALVFEG